MERKEISKSHLGPATHLVQGLLEVLQGPCILPFPHVEHTLHKDPELLDALPPPLCQPAQSSGVQEEVVEVGLRGPVSLRAR